MAALSTNPIALHGTNTALVAAGASGDTVIPGDTTFMAVRNPTGGSISVTVVTPGNDQFGSPAADVVVPVAAGADCRIGPLKHALADPSTHRVGVTYSAAGLMVGVFSI